MPNGAKKGSRDSRLTMLPDEEVTVLQEETWSDRGIMKSESKVGFWCVPHTEKLCGELSNDALISGDGAIRKEEFIEGEVRSSTIKEEARFRKMLTSGT